MRSIDDNKIYSQLSTDCKARSKLKSGGCTVFQLSLKYHGSVKALILAQHGKLITCTL